MENVGEVVNARPEIALGSGVVAFLKGVNENVYKRIDHEEA